MLESAAQLFQHEAEGAFGIGAAHGAVVLAFFGLEAAKVAVVGEQPVFAPHFADEGVGVGQADAALCGFADVGDDVGGFDLVGFYQIGHRRAGAGLVVVEHTHAFVFEKANAKAVGVSVGEPAAQAEAFERENDVGGGVAVHAQKLAHDEFLEIGFSKTGRCCTAMIILTTLRLPENLPVVIPI